MRNFIIIGLLALVVAVPFALRREPPAGDWREGDPVLTIVTPHNEAIRYEFARAFSDWHKSKFGSPVKVDWRNVGGTTEISRYLTSAYSSAFKAWWTNAGHDWSSNAQSDMFRATLPADSPSAALHAAYRNTDDPAAFSSGVDLFFGGGEFDHSAAAAAGFAVPVLGDLPPTLFAEDGIELIPEKLSGETWRTQTVMGNAVSTFGIVYNVDRLKDLGIESPPKSWDDLADFRYFRQVGAADPTKSGSIAKAFEMIVHQKMHDAVAAIGFSNTMIADAESRIAAHQKSLGKDAKPWSVPDDLVSYQSALEQGWLDGIALVQSIGANARYFTDSASKVPIDVSMGDAAIGMAIDFYGRYQAQAARAPDGTERMIYISPVGGTSVSCDPISLLRGAPNRVVAVRFIQFVLSEDGQKLWTYAPGSPGGPERYALRRLPIRRDFYPSTNPVIQKRHEEHKKYAVDDIADPTVNPYALAEDFTYYRRWTGGHFSVMREIVKAMCIDSGDELREAWQRLHANGTPTAEQLKAFHTLPTVTLTGKDAAGNPTQVELPLTWRTAPDIRRNYSALEYMREWTAGFRRAYSTLVTRADDV